MYFSKKVYTPTAYNGVWTKPQKLGNFREFLCENLTTICKITFNCELEKKIGGAGCTSWSPNNFVGGATAPTAPLVPAPMVDTLDDQ